MYAFAHKRKNTYKALALGVVAVYALITWAVPLLHNDDCPATHTTPKAPLQSDRPCPACNFLSTAHATEIHCDSTPGLAPSGRPPEFACGSLVAIASPYAGSIFLRAPPRAPLS
jgi:hypothetical protein